jgi:hypothetical protein
MVSLLSVRRARRRAGDPVRMRCGAGLLGRVRSTRFHGELSWRCRRAPGRDEVLNVTLRRWNHCDRRSLPRRVHERGLELMGPYWCLDRPTRSIWVLRLTSRPLHSGGSVGPPAAGPTPFGDLVDHDDDGERGEEPHRRSSSRRAQLIAGVPGTRTRNGPLAAHTPPGEAVSPTRARRLAGPSGFPAWWWRRDCHKTSSAATGTTGELADNPRGNDELIWICASTS